MSTVTISMPESLREFVDAQMKRQGFDNVTGLTLNGRKSSIFRSLSRIFPTFMKAKRKSCVSEYFRALVREQQAKEADGQLNDLQAAGILIEDDELSEIRERRK